MPIVVPMVTIGPSVISGLISWLVERRGKGSASTEMQHFMILMLFWPQSSLIISKPGQRLSGYRLCFLQHTWHQDKKEQQQQQRNPSQHCMLCFRYLKEHAHLSSAERGWISDLHLDLFAIPFLCFPWENFFFSPRIPVSVFGGFKRWKRERKAHWSQRHRNSTESQAVIPLGLRALQWWLLSC